MTIILTAKCNLFLDFLPNTVTLDHPLHLLLTLLPHLFSILLVGGVSGGSNLSGVKEICRCGVP